MWTVKLTKKAEKDLLENLTKGIFSQEDIRLLKLWCAQIEIHGPEFIERQKIWDDHPLYGKWQGCRSSCFSYAGRVIYKVVNEKILIEVLKVTNDHDYN